MKGTVTYLTGLFLAWLAFVGALALWSVIFFRVPFPRHPGFLRTLSFYLHAGMFFGAFFVVVLAVATGPAIWRIVGRRGGAAIWREASIAGALTAPIHVLAIWLILRDPNETLGGLLGEWRRLPSGDWSFLWPALVGGVVFAWWAAQRRRPRRQATV